jgi:hypothetical protein
VGSVVPFQDHLRYLEDQLMSGSGSPDIAAGKVDVSVAESGISLLLQMGPILSKAEKADEVIRDKHDQMFYDLLHMWGPAYERLSVPEGTTVTAVMGDKLPLNREQRFNELVVMLQNKVVDTQYFREEMTKLGYEFPDDLATRVAAEQLTVDPVSARLGQELAAQTDVL